MLTQRCGMWSRFPFCANSNPGGTFWIRRRGHGAKDRIERSG